MESTEKAVEVYQLRIWIQKISSQIWRRLLVRSDSTIAELHDTLQIAFGWNDEHLHQFLIRGKPTEYGCQEGSVSTTISTRSSGPNTGAGRYFNGDLSALVSRDEHQ